MAAEEAADPLPAGCTITCVAVIVVPLVVPRTRTGSFAVMAVAEAGLVPFSYVVADASLMVTFWPAEVDSVKPDVDTLLTVPTAPPAAGPDRALDPPPPDRGPVAGPLPEGVEVLLEGAGAELLLAAEEPPLDVALTIP